MQIRNLLLTLGVGVVLVGACVALSTPEEVPPQTSEPTPAATAPPSSTLTPEVDIPIIDAHSQCCPENLDQVIPLMDLGGVACTILSPGVTSTKGIITPEELVSFASDYPGRIIPAVRIKVRKNENYYDLLEKQMNMNQHGAMAEVLIYHEAKAGVYPKIVAHFNDESVQATLNYALDKEWPFILHIEFADAGSQGSEFMTELEALLIQYPKHPFVLIHMGQLNHVTARHLIEAHPNIYFITSHSNPIVVDKGTKLWTNMFDGDYLSTDWKELMIEYPDRFILGLDMVWSWDWDRFYLPQITLWRKAMTELPLEVAHAFAHGNAERLWRLPPVE